MLKKFWQGDLPLATMFWIFFLAIPVLFRIVLVVSGVVAINDSAGTGALTIFLIGAAMIIYYIFTFIGTWRSATRYSEGRGGIFGTSGSVDWGLIAKVAMVLILITHGMSF